MLGISSGLMYGGAFQQDTAFRSTWDTRNLKYQLDEDGEPTSTVISSANDTIVLPITGSTGLDFTVWWGDPANTSTHVTAVGADTTFTYDDPGVYTIVIEGVIGDRWQSTSTVGKQDELKLTNISNWGSFTTGDLAYVFQNCSNMTCTATDSLTVGGFTLSYLFKGCASMTAVNTSDWDMSGVTHMDHAFGYCTSLVTVDASNWDTSSFNGIRSCFRECTSLETLDVSEWDMSSVRDMEYFFQSCTSLVDASTTPTTPALDVSGWRFQSHTSFNEVHLKSLFASCTGLKVLDVSNWTTSGVDNMMNLFAGCTGVETLNTAAWDTRSLVLCSAMFQNCIITQAYVAAVGDYVWDMSSVTNMNNMFNNCDGLTDGASLPVQDWDITSVEHCSRFAKFCSNLTEFRGDDWDFSSMLQCYDMFMHCPKLATIDTTDWRFPVATRTSSLFNGCGLLETNTSACKINVTNLFLKADGSHSTAITDINSMFANCVLLTAIDVSNWDVTNVTTCSSIFSKCYALTNAGVAGVAMWNNDGAGSGNPSTTAKLESVGGMFYENRALTTIPIGVNAAGAPWVGPSVTNMDQMFRLCTGLTALDVSAFNTVNVTSMIRTFMSCSALETIDVQAWNVSSATSLRSLFEGCTALDDLGTNGGGTHIGVKNWDVSSLLDAGRLFHTCTSLPSGALDVSDWDTSSVTSTEWMFYNSNVGNIVVTDWDVGDLIDMTGMFHGANIVTLDISDWNDSPSSTAQVRGMSDFVSSCADLRNFDVSNLVTSGAHRVDDFFMNTAITNTAIYAGIANWDISSLKERGQEDWEENTVTNSGLHRLLNSTTNEMSTAEYNAVLEAWVLQDASNMTVDFDAAVADGAGATAHATLVLAVASGGKGWTITDGN